MLRVRWVQLMFSWVMPVSSRQKLERRGKSHRPDERLKLRPLRFGALDQQQHGADFDRLFFPADYSFLPTGRLDVDRDDTALAGEDRFDDIIHGNTRCLGADAIKEEGRRNVNCGCEAPSIRWSRFE